MTELSRTRIGNDAQMIVMSDQSLEVYAKNTILAFGATLSSSSRQKHKIWSAFETIFETCSSIVNRAVGSLHTDDK